MPCSIMPVLHSGGRLDWSKQMSVMKRFRPAAAGVSKRNFCVGSHEDRKVNAMFNYARSSQQYKWVWQNPQWQFGFRPLIQEFWNERPEGVPFTWTTIDIDTDSGVFSEDSFPPGLPGETLEEYCRRVPNIWSPDSKDSDTVDCVVHFSLEYAQDVLLEDHKFTERPMLKICPTDSDYRLEQDWLDLEERGIRQPPLVNGKPLYPVFTKEEVQQVITFLEEGFLRNGHGYYFKSKNWPDFWQEMTGEDTVPEGEFYQKLHSVFMPEEDNFELPDELRSPDELVTEITGKITPPNRWADKQNELLREEEDFKYQLDYDMFAQFRDRMEYELDKSEAFGETKWKIPDGVKPNMHATKKE